MTQATDPRSKILFRAAFGAALAAAGLGASGANAQEITHRFINPSFGGNPFNSDHLRGIAALDRPASPDQVRAGGLTEQQLLIRQIQSRLLSSLSSGLIEAVTGAEPGTSGEFIIGDQRITYERTLTEIRLTFFNETTGEITEIVLPVINPPGPSATSTGLASMSPESVLGGLVYTPGGANGSTSANGANGASGANGNPAGAGGLGYNGPLENGGPVEAPLGGLNF